MENESQAAELDLQTALARLGGAPEFLKEVAQLFLGDYGNSLDQIRQALAGRNAKLLETSAHTLKGTVSIFGAPRSVQAAQGLEHKARAGDWSGVDDLAANLETALAQLKRELEALG